jgi:tetratricopeptide (TPR) repeat protein
MNVSRLKMPLILAGLVFGLLVLTPSLHLYYLRFSLDKGVFHQDMIYKMIGESRRIFSRVCMMRADEYFHGGVTLAAQKCRYGANAPKPSPHAQQEHALHQIKGEDHHHHHAHEEDHSAFKKVEAIKGVPRWNCLLYLGELINIDKHMHLREEEQKEMVPWYIFAVQLDPHNVHAYVIGGYWIGTVLEDTEEAIRFLKRGLTQNPKAWPIYAALGELYFQQQKDYGQALRSFQKAASLFTKENVTPHESWEVYLFIAACHEWLGNTQKALTTYENILKYFPDDKVSRQKVEELRSELQSTKG